jgi:hypothetical protein
MRDHVLLDMFRTGIGDVATFLLAAGAHTVEAEDDPGNGEVLGAATFACGWSLGNR